MNMEAKSISTKLKINGRVERIPRTPAFVALKEQSNLSFNKSIKELGKVSKGLVEKMNSDMIENLQLNQWRHTDAVLKWFNNITDKSNRSFIQFDIKEFYPSITEIIVHQKFKFAKQYTNINKNHLPIINYCASHYFFLITKLRKKKRQTAALTSQWVVLMKQKYVN